jgi:ADP-ribosylglycohydrolase
MSITYYPHLTATDADYAHGDAIRYAFRSQNSEHSSLIHDATALTLATHESNLASAGAFVRAYVSTKRALDIEARDIFESGMKVWRERHSAVTA